MSKSQHHNRRAFTIIELLVVIVVIGILTSLSVFAFSGWRSQVAKTEVQNDINGVYAAMQSAKNWNNGYPSVPENSVFNGTDNNTKTIGNFSPLNYQDVYAIFKLANH